MLRTYRSLGRIAGGVAGIALAVALSGVAMAGGANSSASGGAHQNASETSRSSVNSTAISFGRGAAVAVGINVTNQTIVQFAPTFVFSGARNYHRNTRRHG